MALIAEVLRFTRGLGPQGSPGTSGDFSRGLPGPPKLTSAEDLQGTSRGPPGTSRDPWGTAGTSGDLEIPGISGDYRDLRGPPEASRPPGPWGPARGWDLRGPLAERPEA